LAEGQRNRTLASSWTGINLALCVGRPGLSTPRSSSCDDFVRQGHACPQLTSTSRRRR
jgi:hypothetical protein